MSRSVTSVGIELPGKRSAVRDGATYELVPVQQATRPNGLGAGIVAPERCYASQLGQRRYVVGTLQGIGKLLFQLADALGESSCASGTGIGMVRHRTRS